MVQIDKQHIGILLILLVVTIYLFGLNYFFTHKTTRKRDKLKFNDDKLRNTTSFSISSTASSVKQKQNIILLGYLRGGTTFLGDILGVRTGSFYLYEPLFELGTFDYFKQGETCRMTYNSCVLSYDHKKALAVLDAIFNCDFNSVKDVIRLWQFTKGRGMVNVSKPVECEGKGIQECLLIQNAHCQKATTRVIKIARTDMALLENVIYKHRNVKIVHLIRDPRAVIGSRYVSWPVHFRNTIQAARSLCTKIKEDYESGVRINQKYPGKVFTLFYEDIATDAIEYSKKLYSFVGYDFNEEDLKRISKMTSSNSNLFIPKSLRMWTTLKTNSSAAAYKWRTSIPPSISSLVNLVCHHIYEMFDYPSLQNVEELHDISIPLRLFKQE